jgi:hypothetical protein
MMGLSGQSLALRGDSVTALTWAITERPRGAIVTNASMMWILLCVATEIDVREVIHISGVDNVNCDRLSRRGSDATLSLEEEAHEMGLGGTTVVEMNGNDSVMEILRLCDPKISLTSELDFICFWKRARNAISEFLSAHPIKHTQHSYKDSSSINLKIFVESLCFVTFLSTS